MAVTLDTPTPIDPDDPQVQKMLAKLQGNILKGHGRDHTVHIFIELDPGSVADKRTKLAAFANKVVTSALKQHQETKEFQEFRIPGSLFGSLFLTARGYRSLGFTAAQINAAFPDSAGGTASYFIEGMQAHGGDLHDPPPADWDKGYRDGNIDAMILLADADEAFLLRQARALINELDDFSTILVVERGNALRTKNGEGIEHFGYVDGRSQPIYFTTDLTKEGEIDKWNPTESLEIVLVKDLAVNDAEAFGSYFVFRKLEQDVRRFKMNEQELADALGLQEQEKARAGAMVVGRFEDGTPLALSQTDGFVPLKENNFTYAVDPEGAKCPFQAHIRKCNPRGDIKRRHNIPEEIGERPRRITRRGITYAKRNLDAIQGLADLPTTGVGLLFMCFQSSIANQFAFIQQSWVNAEDFLVDKTGLDPVIGQPKPGGPAPIAQRWPVQWGPRPDPANPGNTKPPDIKDFFFGGFVTLKGGEFFFAPSMPFLKTLEPPQ